MPPAANRKTSLRHERPPPPIQKASRRTNRANHWLPATPPLCKPLPHSASLRDLPPPPPPFLDGASPPALSDWVAHLALTAGRSPIGGGKFPGQTNRPRWGSRLLHGWALCADWLLGGFERFQRPQRRGPDGAAAGGGQGLRRSEALPGSRWNSRAVAVRR